MEFANPLTFSSLTELLAALLNVFIIITIPIAVFFLIYGGFMYVTARGSVEKIQTAHKSILYSLAGGVIIIGAVWILNIVKATVESF